jgi:hypothetical protein
MLHRLMWLVKSLLMRLTQARRVLLALALVLVLSGLQRVEFGSVRVGFPLSRTIGDILLFVLLMLELKDKLLARDELEAGRKVQIALIPERAFREGMGSVAVHRGNDVGGESHRVMRARARAALLMVKLQATLRALVPQFDTFSELGAALNRILVRDGLPNRFATLVYLVLTSDSGDVRLLNAGHMPPLVIRGRTIEELPRGSTALGLMPDAPFTEQQLVLSPGDVIVVYSDGITEAMNLSGEFFGDERLRAGIETAGQLARHQRPHPADPRNLRRNATPPTTYRRNAGTSAQAGRAFGIRRREERLCRGRRRLRSAAATFTSCPGLTLCDPAGRNAGSQPGHDPTVRSFRGLRENDPHAINRHSQFECVAIDALRTGGNPIVVHAGEDREALNERVPCAGGRILDRDALGASRRGTMACWSWPRGPARERSRSVVVGYPAPVIVPRQLDVQLLGAGRARRTGR